MKDPREIDLSLVTEAVKDCSSRQTFPLARIFTTPSSMPVTGSRNLPSANTYWIRLIRNHDVSRSTRCRYARIPVWRWSLQTLGRNVVFRGGDLVKAVNSGVEEAYREGFFRRSVVSDPLFDRKNTGTNTPAVIHTRIVPGDRVTLLVTPQGFGTENMSALKMFTPAEGPEKVRDFVKETVEKAGPNPCPPTIVGVGVGGTVEAAAIMAKRATLYPIGKRNSDRRYAALENETLAAVNDLGIGPAGLGGRVTCLDVHIDFAPGHIAGTPVVVNICCHASRHAEVTL